MGRAVEERGKERSRASPRPPEPPRRRSPHLPAPAAAAAASSFLSSLPLFPPPLFLLSLPPFPFPPHFPFSAPPALAPPQPLSPYCMFQWRWRLLVRGAAGVSSRSAHTASRRSHCSPDPLQPPSVGCRPPRPGPRAAVGAGTPSPPSREKAPLTLVPVGLR